MKLKKLLAGLEILSATADPEQEVAAIRYDSRVVEPGDVFVAMRGFATDGHKYIPQAMERGAAAVICEVPPLAPYAANGGANETAGTGDKAGGAATPYVQVGNARRALAVMGANFYDHPADHMIMVGVTGTNGKTSSTYLLKAILEAEPGNKVGLIGTNQNMIGTEILPAERTTPESLDLQALFARMRDAGCTHVVMEVSSHALVLERVYGVRYRVGVFTNLTQDHLDFHGSMEAYCDAKAILFQNCKTGVVNAGDPWTGRLLQNAACEVFTYGTRPGVNLRAEDVELYSDHVAFMAVCMGERVRVRVNIPGGFMVYNTLDALAAARTLGIPLKISAQVLRTVPPVKGRMEAVPTPGKPYTILIDYAHSPDGIENVLKSVKGFAQGRTIALFGCGGDRDKTKRPQMGALAAALADFVVITTDNPRTEKPAKIIADILPGLDGTPTPYIVIEDRIEAIHYCMDNAQAGDVIVLCGKGHETYQEINHVKYHMDEREIVADYL